MSWRFEQNKALSNSQRTIAWFDLWKFWTPKSVVVVRSVDQQPGSLVLGSVPGNRWPLQAYPEWDNSCYWTLRKGVADSQTNSRPMLAIGTIDSQARVSCTFASRHQEWKDPCPDTCNHRSTRRNQWLEWNRQEGNGDPWRHDHRTLDRQECCQGEWCHHAYRFNERQGSPRDHQRQDNASLEIRLRESWVFCRLGRCDQDDNDNVRTLAESDAKLLDPLLASFHSASIRPTELAIWREV